MRPQLTRCWGGALLMVAIVGPAGAVPPSTAPLLFDHPDLVESSGLARSQVTADRWWTHNDSGSSAVLYALERDGDTPSVRAFPLRYGLNIDWEDLSSFVRNGRAHLLVADVGDNWALRGSVALHWVEEPQDLASQGDLGPVFTRLFDYPDGPRDVEAVAVEPQSAQVYLISKRDDPPRLYRLSLEGQAPPVVNRAVSLGTLKLPTSARGRRGRWITALDIDARGRRAAVLSLEAVYLYDRRADEGWETAFSRPPQVIRLPPLAQAEAVALTAAGDALVVSSEGRPMPLLVLQLSPPPP